ncbi:hypothetical protein EVAR_81627_1 [Eumeta japonica]|uniref:Uncharacterized protein n=1 Tax=Eumeta variegata TaxID=151549 RepID=A0A4C1WG06_EUMVA|nr:hypothetical protein EVAR_81627_1 [Eumeta japonica]
MEMSFLFDSRPAAVRDSPRERRPRRRDFLIRPVIIFAALLPASYLGPRMGSNFLPRLINSLWKWSTAIPLRVRSANFVQFRSRSRLFTLTFAPVRFGSRRAARDLHLDRWHCAGCGWESLMKSVTLGNVTMITNERPALLALSHSTMIGLPRMHYPLRRTRPSAGTHRSSDGARGAREKIITEALLSTFHTHHQIIDGSALPGLACCVGPAARRHEFLIERVTNRTLPGRDDSFAAAGARPAPVVRG